LPVAAVWSRIAIEEHFLPSERSEEWSFAAPTDDACGASLNLGLIEERLAGLGDLRRGFSDQSRESA
jgi:hypothetical protein